MLCKKWRSSGAYGIRVNSVSPGMIMTLMTQAIYEDTSIARQREAIVPLRRIGVPDDVARVVAFLIDPENRYVTGREHPGRWRSHAVGAGPDPGIARRKPDAPLTEVACLPSALGAIRHDPRCASALQEQALSAVVMLDTALRNRRPCWRHRRSG